MLLAAFAGTTSADNTSSTVSQVSSAVALSDDVDFHISSTEPFTATGSIDITNTDHAVVIFDNLRPSLAAQQLGYVTINGEAAKNNVNCQVRIYDNGAMVLPYTNDKVLTVYSELGLQGESCSDFDLSNTGGFMNSLTTEQLNNRIKSFKLKRGYMVTFSLKAGGKGYSRCFVAANSDLEFDLPTLMQNRISSYRIFKWNNTSKKGLANDTGSESNSALNTQWCYSFGAGADAGVDRECVPHGIYSSWPSASSLGSTTYSPHLKTSNEPANSSDDHPESVATVLNVWENYMATGMRLCSPSQHDGGLSWTREFMDSIDARGWRCDIVDIHCYWPEWNLLNQVNGYYTTYGRPIWISEWIWGASWNKNGVFASSDPENENVTVLKKVLANWNSSKYIERYAYWNSESKGKIYDGGITKSGVVYRDTPTGVGYNPDIQFVPKAPRMSNPSNLTLSFLPSSMVATLTWSDTNGELLEAMYLERQKNNGEWQAISSFPISETSTSFTYKDTISGSGTYNYRVHTVAYNGVSRYSNEQQNVINGAETLGDGTLQYGTITTDNNDLAYNFFAQTYEDENKPIVVFGSVSNFQSKAAFTERVSVVIKQRGIYKYFRSNISPWADYDETSFYNKNVATGAIGSEYTSYIISKAGTGKIGTLDYEAVTLEEDTANRVWDVTFTTPFVEAPVVLATPQYSNDNYSTMIARVYDVTATGCKVKLMKQKSQASKNGRASINLFAIAQGTTTDGNGKELTVKAEEFTFKTSNITKVKEYDKAYKNPAVLAQMQSLNRNVAAILRTRPNSPDTLALRLRYQVDSSDDETLTKVNSSNPVTETVGYIIISDDESYNGVVDIKADTRRAKTTAVYDLQGRKVDANGNLPKGIYIINGRKVVVR